VDPCRIFAGNASRKLAQAICDRLQVPLGDADVSRFEDGEVSVRFNENIRGGDVFIVQATGAPADYLMELQRRILAIWRPWAPDSGSVIVMFDTSSIKEVDSPATTSARPPTIISVRALPADATVMPAASNAGKKTARHPKPNSPCMSIADGRSPSSPVRSSPKSCARDSDAPVPSPK